MPRDVGYQYANPDPEQVTSLTHVSGALSGLPFATYTYDAAGNQVTRCYGATTTPTCAGESMDFLYDGKDQLRRATRKLNGIVQASEEYWYDSGGARTAIVKRDAAGNKTELIRFIGEVESHYDGTGAVTEVRSHVSLGIPLGRISRTSDSNAPLEFQHHGLSSNTIAAVAFNGTVNASMSYSPFGEIVEALGPELSGHTRRMNDKYVDELTALAYYGARYYDRIAIQWTQADPVYLGAPEARSARPRSGNIYQFSLNNTLRYIDNDGLDARPSLSFYRSEMEAVNAGRALNQISAYWGVSTNSCSHNANRCFFILHQDNSKAIEKAANERMRVVEVPSPETQPFGYSWSEIADPLGVAPIYRKLHKIDQTATVIKNAFPREALVEPCPGCELEVRTIEPSGVDMVKFLLLMLSIRLTPELPGSPAFRASSPARPPRPGEVPWVPGEPVPAPGPRPYIPACQNCGSPEQPIVREANPPYLSVCILCYWERQ